jgi:hypothetical protein
MVKTTRRNLNRLDVVLINNDGGSVTIIAFLYAAAAYAYVAT